MIGAVSLTQLCWFSFSLPSCGFLVVVSLSPTHFLRTHSYKDGIDLGKLFIGGISWDTYEERLMEYFATYGKVIEAVITRDHATGRAHGFGFVVFVILDLVLLAELRC